MFVALYCKGPMGRQTDGYMGYHGLPQPLSLGWVFSAGAVVQRAGLLITGSLVRTHSGASFVITFASLSPASAWPSLA